MESTTVIYTVGQGGRSVEALAALLRDRDIQFVCDVRSVPISNHAPQFCREELRELLARAGITYVWMGSSLGGRPQEKALFTADGRVDYVRLMEWPAFQAGLDRLIHGAGSGHRLAVFCSEGEPERCHRSKAIGVALERRGIGVMHIDASGKDTAQADVMARLASQASLFADVSDPATVSRGRYL